MKSKIVLFIAMLSAAMVFVSVAHAQVTVGQAAPNFTLTDSNGETVALSKYAGKFVVLEWTNHDCPFVKKHYDSSNMQNLQSEYTSQDVVWLSINSSAEGKQGHVDGEQANALIEEKGASPTAYLLDPQGTVGKLYAAQTTPHMYIIDPKGILIYQGAIDDKASADPEDIATSKNYVHDALAAAMAGQAVTTATTKAYGCSVKY
ncbi:MAG: thioredoxin family protein [Candidatus Omnitrophica bacterium]|nr:thioredoxin family protein [Candidatus Omnitrophota bacterium]